MWIGVAGIAALCGFVSEVAAMQWQPAAGKHGERMAAKSFSLSQGEGVEAYLIHPDLERQPLGMIDQQGQLKLKPTGKENYHALLAVRKNERLTEVAIRYLFMHGKPTGYSPSRLVYSDKAELEIVPNPLPREHWRYVANRPAEFLVRFNGQPLGNFPVVVNTSNGSRLVLETDRAGVLHLEIPDDFISVKPGSRNNPPAEWWLDVDYSKDGHTYRTVYSAAYHVDTNHWQPLSWGLTVVAGAMLFTGVLGFRRRRNIPVASGRRAGKKGEE